MRKAAVIKYLPGNSTPRCRWMCKICDIAANSPYASKMEAWVLRDVAKIERHKNILKSQTETGKVAQNQEKTSDMGTSRDAQNQDAIVDAGKDAVVPGAAVEAWSSVKWPLRINFPIFEPRAPLAVPTNYFQTLSIDGTAQPKKWGHDSTRAIGIKGGKLIVISKFASKSGFEDTLQSYYLFSIGLDEAEVKMEPNGSIEIRAEKDIALQNLIDGKIEKKHVKFNFTHKPIQNAIVSQEQARANSRVQEVYGKGGFLLPHSDIENYFVTVPNFFPHPYLLEQYALMGYASRRDFQIAGPVDYFKEHLKR